MIKVCVLCPLTLSHHHLEGIFSYKVLRLFSAQAKEMVELSKSIANKVKEKQGDVTEDETIRFKSYLLSMGIANPVTRETYGSGTQYHMQLAKQLAGILQAPLEERGGIMSLTEVYCLVNRARGMEVRRTHLDALSAEAPPLASTH